MKKIRADEVLFEQIALPSLQLSRALIMEGRVMQGDRKILKTSELIDPNSKLRVRGEIDAYVSRGAHKLKKALEVFRIDLSDQVCMDIGASTGGFTDVMLRGGASRVYAVDVGYNLLDYRLRSDQRVVCMERTNARFIEPEQFNPRPRFGATDVSFISLKAILPAAFRVLGEAGRFVALVKPQFEALPNEVGERGVVRDPEVQIRVLNEIAAFVPTLNWRVNGLSYSPIRGPEGNIEFLMDMTPEGSQLPSTEVSVRDTVQAAYDKFLKSLGKGL
ncbi:MAG: TlyA family RNA methyltransferase [Clostridia bacterium]|nr:TlyA family RNA methyltransferase [Clostridia bacterium]